jgi:hypothetical protein
MADNELTKVSTALLPMDDIAAMLNIAYDFVTRADKATDVEKVAGVLAEVIAVATSPSDRTTVRNAENLGNLPAADYMTKLEGGKIVKDSNHIKKVYSDEFRDLRDELYQLRMELAKSGVVTDYLPYAGYHDLFKLKKPTHVHDVIATAIADSTNTQEIVVIDEEFLKFDKDDWIALAIKNVEYYHVARITEMKPDGQTIVFAPSCPWNITAGNVDVYKSLGEVVDGAYCFLKHSTLLPDSKEMYSCLNDDTFRMRRQIKNKNVGYGYTFRIPETQKGFLTKFDIQAKTYGTPGSLMCYIIDELNIDKWKNPTQAEADGILLAKSQPLSHDAAYGERIVGFEFWDGTKFPLLNEPDTFERKVRYCCIIEALDADDSNYYDIVFLQHKRADNTMGDLQLNNITYNYEKKEDSSPDTALKTDDLINATDLYYGITTRGVINNGFTPHREAVYTAHFKTHEPVEASRARLTMRINREGYFTTNVTKADVFSDNSSLPVKKADGLTFSYDMSELAGFGLRKDDEDVIVGTDIRRILNQNSSSVVLKKGLYVEPDMPVYRAGYDITLKARLVRWDEATCQFVELDVAKIPLQLMTVMPDANKKNIRISDRLVYEGDYLTDDLEGRYFNDFELQVHWHTEYSGMYEDQKYKADLVGKIHDLVLSLDRTI